MTENLRWLDLLKGFPGFGQLLLIRTLNYVKLYVYNRYSDQVIISSYPLEWISQDFV